MSGDTICFSNAKVGVLFLIPPQKVETQKTSCYTNTFRIQMYNFVPFYFFRLFCSGNFESIICSKKQCPEKVWGEPLNLFTEKKGQKLTKIGDEIKKVKNNQNC